MKNMPKVITEIKLYKKNIKALSCRRIIMSKLKDRKCGW